jgi:phosphoribosylformylglycinamidine synthase
VPIIAPCNGFQVAVQLGLLPGPGAGESWAQRPPVPSVTLADNESARFVDRWVRVVLPADSRCIWTQGLSPDDQTSLLPVAHGEGRFIPASSELLENLDRNGQVVVRYAADDNPNGSVGNVAGICDTSGLVLGLMPHPERYYRWTQHPWWTRLEAKRMQGEPLGLAMFRNAVAHAARAVSV